MTDESNLVVRLDEFDKDEWRDVCRVLRPDWTEEQFEQAWQKNMKLKAARRTQ